MSTQKNRNVEYLSFDVVCSEFGSVGNKSDKIYVVRVSAPHDFFVIARAVVRFAHSQCLSNEHRRKCEVIISVSRSVTCCSEFVMFKNKCAKRKCGFFLSSVRDEQV